MMRRGLIGAAVLVLLLVGCGKKQEASSTKTIGVSLLTRQHVFYKDLEEGLRTEAAKNGYQLVLTSGDFDLGKQSSQIEDFLTKKVDAILFGRLAARATAPAIKKANDAMIASTFWV